MEHDLSVLDYLSDFICCLYGVPGAYGVVTLPIGVREGINVFLDGYIPAENLRFRETSMVFKVSEQAEPVSLILFVTIAFVMRGSYSFAGGDKKDASIQLPKHDQEVGWLSDGGLSWRVHRF